MAESSKTNLKQWLQNLARESWQLELLVSAFTIFLLVQAFGAFSEFLLSFPYKYNMLNPLVSLAFLVLGAIAFSIRILIISLVAHLLLRGFWIGAIGLKSVQPEIDLSTFRYSEFFTKKLEKRIMNLDDMVVRLDEICSVIFALSFLLISIIISVGLYVFVAGIIAMAGQYFGSFENPGLSNFFTGVFGMIMLVYMIAGLIYAIDFLSLGFFKKFKLFSKIYFPFYRFFGIITLALISRSISYYIIQKFSKRNIRLLYVFVVITIIAWISIDFDQFQYFSDSDTVYNIENSYYDDKRSEKAYVESASIPSISNSGSHLQLFIRYLASDNEMLANHCPDFIPEKLDGLNLGLTITARQEGFEVNEETFNEVYNREALNCLSSIYSLELNNKKLEGVKYYFNKHYQTGQPGLLTIIDLEEIEAGMNSITIKKLTMQKPDSLSFNTIASIPFWQE